MKTGRFRNAIFGVLLFGVGVCAGQSASAQSADEIIGAYNQAQNGGSLAARTSAAEALGAFAVANPTRDDAYLLVYEAGQTLCRLDQCIKAKPLTEWLSTKEGGSTDVDPSDVAVLIALVDWTEKPRGKQRKALDKALAAIVDRAPSLLSVAAFQRRYGADVGSQSNWGRTSQSAGEAAKHFEPYKDLIGQQWSSARTSELAARFNDKRDRLAVLDMAKHDRLLRDMIVEVFQKEGDRPDWMDEHRYRAEAWTMAMEAYFRSEKTRATADKIRQEVDEILGDFAGPTEWPETEEEKPDTQKLPFCGGTFNMKPALQYPRAATERGLYGAALMKITITNGEVSDVEALAAVPFEGFKASAAETISKWKWVSNDPGVGKTCGLDRENIILPLTFALD